MVEWVGIEIIILRLENLRDYAHEFIFIQKGLILEILFSYCESVEDGKSNK